MPKEGGRRWKEKEGREQEQQRKEKKVTTDQSIHGLIEVARE